jgi:hypothetical protein
MTRREEFENESEKYASFRSDSMYNKSALYNARKYAWQDGAFYADDTLMKKVCDFLSNVDIWKYTSSLTSGVVYMNFRRDEFINDLKKFCNNIQVNTLDYENLVG